MLGYHFSIWPRFTKLYLILKIIFNHGNLIQHRDITNNIILADHYSLQIAFKGKDISDISKSYLLFNDGDNFKNLFARL